jgi:hypothetical protein
MNESWGSGWLGSANEIRESLIARGVYYELLKPLLQPDGHGGPSEVELTVDEKSRARNATWRSSLSANHAVKT